MLVRVLEQGRRVVQDCARPIGPVRRLDRLWPGVPSELGLPSDVGFRVVVEGRQRELTPCLWDDAYRIGREAIVNAYRYSRAKDIETAIEYRPAELRIAVRDNGCEIDPQQLKGDGTDTGVCRERASVRNASGRGSVF